MEQNNFYQRYCRNINQALQKIDLEKLGTLSDSLWETLHARRQVLLCGNGGSAANAIHIANDLLYGIGKSGDAAFRVHALTANPAIMTCLANDISYDEIFSYQLQVLAQKDDILIALSGSGNSPNILKALQTANTIGMKTYAILGYDGGRCIGLADESIHIPIDDMQVSEDIQLVIGHMVVQWIRQRIRSEKDT